MQISHNPAIRQNAESPRRIGSQAYPQNEALDSWAGTAEVHTLPDFFRQAAAKYADRPFIGAKGEKDYEYLTYAQTLEKVEDFHSALIELGIAPGERVGTYMDNAVEGRITDLGTLDAGCISAPLVDKLTDDKVQSTLQTAAHKMVVVDNASRLKQVVSLESQLPDLAHIVVLDGVDTSEVKTSKQLHTWSDLMNRGHGAAPAHADQMKERREAIKYDDVGGMVHTSGSTGNPKWVALSHGNWLGTIDGVVKKFTGNEAETVASVTAQNEVYPAGAPEGHVMGRAVSNAVAAMGGKVPYPAGQTGFLKDLRQLQPTFLVLSPAHYQNFYDGAQKAAHKQTERVISPQAVRIAAATLGGVLGGLGGAFIGMPVAGAALGASLGGAVSSASEGGLLEKINNQISPAKAEGETTLSPGRAAALSATFGAAVGALGGALVGNPIGGAALGSAIAGGIGSLASKLKFSKAQAFDWSVQSAQEFYEAKTKGDVSLTTGLKFAAAEKAVFPNVRREIDKKTGGNIKYMLSGGAALGSTLESFFRGLGYKVSQGYGLSETTGPITLGNLHTTSEAAVDPKKAGLAGAGLGATVGAAVGCIVGGPVAWGVAGAALLGGVAAWAANKFTQTEVFSEFDSAGKPVAGAEVKIGENNEILLKGPGVMTGGYLDQPEKTAESFTDDGWYKTGDCGRIENGNLIIKGRIKSQFKLPNGEYVTPEPIEDALRASPYIKEAVVVGDTAKSRVGALVVPNFDALTEWASQNGVSTEPAQMAADPKVIELIKSDASERTKDRIGYERVGSVAVLDHEFSGDEVTGKGNFVRPVVTANYEENIRQMFA